MPQASQPASPLWNRWVKSSGLTLDRQYSCNFVYCDRSLHRRKVDCMPLFLDRELDWSFRAEWSWRSEEFSSSQPSVFHHGHEKSFVPRGHVGPSFDRNTNTWERTTRAACETLWSGWSTVLTRWCSACVQERSRAKAYRDRRSTSTFGMISRLVGRMSLLDSFDSTRDSWCFPVDLAE